MTLRRMSQAPCAPEWPRSGSSTTSRRWPSWKRGWTSARLDRTDPEVAELPGVRLAQRRPLIGRDHLERRPHPRVLAAGAGDDIGAGEQEDRGTPRIQGDPA